MFESGCDVLEFRSGSTRVVATTLAWTRPWEARGCVIFPVRPTRRSVTRARKFDHLRKSRGSERVTLVDAAGVVGGICGGAIDAVLHRADTHVTLTVDAFHSVYAFPRNVSTNVW